MFVELFCTPKSSIENPSLRVNGHGGSTSTTVIVENFAEDEFGQCAIDEVTGEQGYIDGERSFFRTWDDNEKTWQSRPFKGRQARRRKGKGKGGFKGTGRAFLGEAQAEDPEWWSEEDYAWWSKGKKVKKGSSKRKNTFLNLISTPIIQKKVHVMTFIRVKEEERNRKEKARKVPILNLDFQHQNRQVKKDMVIPGSDMIGTLILLMILRIQPQKELLRGMVRNTPHGWHRFTLNLANHPTHVVLDLGCTRSIGSRAAIRRFQKHALYCGITTDCLPLQ